MAPGVERYGFLQIRPLPVVDAGRYGVECRQSFLGRRQPADIESELLERLVERIDLCVRGFDARLANLREVARCNKPGEQADDDHHDQQLEQRKTPAAAAAPILLYRYHGSVAAESASACLGLLHGRETRPRPTVGWRSRLAGKST